MLSSPQVERLVTPLIIMGILVFGSFLPLIQIMLMTLNGAIMYPLYSMADSDEIASRNIYVIDSIMSLIGLTLFYLSDRVLWAVLSAIFTVFFLLPLMVLISESIDTELYFLKFMVAGFTVGFVLLVVALLKKVKPQPTPGGVKYQ